MAVTDDEVRHVAALARLAVDEAALPRLAADLRGILQHMAQLSSFAGTPAASPPAAATTALRDDVPRGAGEAPPLAAFAPVVRDGFFVVPQVVSHEGTVGWGDAAEGPA